MKVRHYLLALLIVALASAARMLWFADLGRATPYLLYYPAVMIAALFGGLYGGLLATCASAMLCFFWIQQGYVSRVEMLAMVAFIISCTMISGITEAMRRAEARAKLEKDRAEAANIAKSAFLARMSHELRTPLNAILGFAEILRRDPAISSSSMSNLNIISRSGEHLLSIIDDVLDMSKIDSDRVVVEATDFDIGEVLREAVDLLRLRAQEKGLTLTLEVASGFPRYVRADMTKVRQIIINLVGNAIKYTERGGVTLRLQTLPGADAEAMRMILEVADTGVGISTDDQQRIFDPFVQAGGARLQKGTGLGLAITRKFVKLMGGELTVSSEIGKGSVFRADIPVERAAASDLQPQEVLGRVVGLAPGQRAYRILVVEDQEENWQLLQQQLEPAGFQVRIAEDGMAGVALFEAWRPDLIFMDIRMPVMDGLEATRRIRALDGGKDVKIVAVTASVFKEEADNVRAAGMDHLVRKPYRSEEIFGCIERYLGATFVTEGAAADKPAPAAAVLSPSALAKLPETLRAELGAALPTLDENRITESIRRIAELDSALGEALTQATAKLDYNAILLALRDKASNSRAAMG